MHLVIIAFILLGPIIVLGVWLWLRSRRERPYLAEPLDIGRVFGGTFSVLGRGNLPVILLAIAVLGGARGIATIITHYWVSLPPLPQPGDPAYLASLWPRFEFELATGLGLFVAGLCFHIPAILFLVKKQEGAEITFRQAATSIPKYILPVIGLTIVMTIGVGFASLLFLIPGVILWLSWLAAMVALVTEGDSIFGALRRSRELSVGSRGRILLIVILLGLIAAIVLWPMAKLEQDQITGHFAVSVVVQMAVATITGLLGVGFSTSLYVELRRIREGGAMPGLAEVFA
ncbi:MAG TPA: hypothetical protein VFL92_00055 [Sphingomonas sp.]|nr:hypothetical protein [Sphingomonas sp.]